MSCFLYSEAARAIPSVLNRDIATAAKWNMQIINGLNHIMRYVASKKVFNYWNNLRKERPAPHRHEIEPSDIRDILGDTFILEIDQAYKTVSFRLAGTRLCSAYARELKGVGFLGLWDEVDNMGIYNSIKKVYEHFTPCTISYIAETESKKFLEYELVLLPLKSGETGSERILGLAVPASIPEWMGVEPIVNNRLRSVRHIKVEDSQSLSGLTAPFKEQTEVSTKARKVAHLTVFEGGLNN